MKSYDDPVEQAEEEIEIFERPSVNTSRKLMARVRELEAEVERLKYFSPYPEDNPEIETTEELNSNSALFNKYGG